MLRKGEISNLFDYKPETAETISLVGREGTVNMSIDYTLLSSTTDFFWSGGKP